MKHLLLIAIAFVTIQTNAQDHKKDQQRNHIEMMKKLSPEDRASIRTKRMTLELDLNAAQQTQVKKILLQEATEKQQNIESRQNTKKGERKEVTQEDYVKHINNKLDHKIEMKSKMKKVLTPEQYKKWELASSKRHKKDKQKRGRKARQ